MCRRCLCLLVAIYWTLKKKKLPLLKLIEDKCCIRNHYCCLSPFHLSFAWWTIESTNPTYPLHRLSSFSAPGQTIVHENGILCSAALQFRACFGATRRIRTSQVNKSNLVNLSLVIVHQTCYEGFLCLLGILANTARCKIFCIVERQEDGAFL